MMKMMKPLLYGVAMSAMAASFAFAETANQTANPDTSAPEMSAPANPATPARNTGPSNSEDINNAASAGTLVGLEVRNAQSDKIGRIEDVVVAADGRVQQVVISVGGFLGVGAKNVAVSWNDLHFDPTGQGATINMTKEQLKAEPEFKKPSEG